MSGKRTAGRHRPIKVVLQRVNTKHEILRKAPSVRHDDATFNNVVIKRDLPHLDRLENKRLYDAFQVAQRDNPNKTVTLKRGILTVDGAQVDQFDPLPRIFRN